MQKKKILLVSHFLVLLALGASLSFAINVPHDDDDDCEEEPECCEGDNGDSGNTSSSPCSACVDSFSLNLSVGGSPHDEKVGAGELHIHKKEPSPAIFTPQGIVFEDRLETFVGETDETAREVTIIRFNGKSIIYQFPSGSSQGSPTGNMARSRTRLHMLDQAGAPTSSMSGAVTYERVFPTGAVIRYNRATSLAESLTTAGGRTIMREGRGIEVIREKLEGLDVIRQVKGSRAFADIQFDPGNDPYGYEIHLYAPGQVGSKQGGLYQLTGSAHTIWRIENPNASDTNLDEVLVTKTAGSKSWEFYYEYTDSIEEWSLSRGDPLGAYRVERKSANSGPGWPNTVGAQRTVTRELFDNEPEVGNLLSKEARTQEVFAWGRETVQTVTDPDGLALTTTYAYYTNDTEQGRYGRMKSIQRPDGRWLVYDYDSFGRKTLEKRGWLDATFDAPAANSRVIDYSYEAVDAEDVDYGLNPISADDLGSFSRKPRREVEKIAGQEVGRTYYAYKTVSGERVYVEERAASVGASYGNTGNVRAVDTYYAPGTNVESGRLKSRRDPAGRTEAYSYSIAGDELVIQKDLLFGAADASHIPVENLSTREIRHIDSRGLEVERKVSVYTGSGYDDATPIEHEISSYNEYSELDEKKRGDDGFILYESVWLESQKDSETDRFGVKTTFSYNALEQVDTSTKEGVAAFGSYPAQPAIVTLHDSHTADSGCGCGAAESRSITVNGVTYETVVKNDMADRLLSQKDENGFETSYSYANGGRIVTKTLPSAATEITEKYLDGQIKSVTGTAVVARYFTYGTDSGGNRHTLTTVGTPTSSQWEKTTANMLGRIVEVEKPAFGAQNHLTQYIYDDEGRIAEMTVPGKANTLYEYDEAGNLFRTGYKVDGVGSKLVPASNDRITENETTYVKENSDWFRKKVTSLYATDASGTATDVEVAKERLSGFATDVLSEISRFDTNGNETTETVTVDRTAKLATVETAVPGSNIFAKKIVRNGLLQEENESDLAVPVVYAYDGFGRRVKSIDPRTGATDITYREFIVDGQTYTGSLVETWEDPAANITTHIYHESGAGSGRVSSREAPDGKKTYFTYNLRDQQTHIWGSTYPVEYEYDGDFGWRTKQHTYRGGSNWFNPTWPSSPGTADTNTWHYQEKTGLLEAKEYADTNRTEYTYTTAGELATRTWARQVGGQDLITTYTYWESAGGELKKVDYSDATPDVEFTYTRAGQSETVTDAVGTRTFGYTAQLQLDTEDIDAGQNGLYSLLLTSKYEGIGTGKLPGRPAGVSLGTTLDPDADCDTTWHYDAAGRFARVQGPGLPSYGAEYGYLANGHRMEKVSYKTDATTTVASSTYSPLSSRDLVEGVENMAGTVTISKYQYGYNSVGQRTSVENSGSAFSQVAHNMFDYNDRREVIDSKRLEGTLASPGSEILAQRRAYQFDPIGNRSSRTEGGGSPVSYTANALNQYTSGPEAYSFDIDGNLVALSDGEQWAFTWDAENRLATASSVSGMTASFTYDYKGRRVRAIFDTLGVITEERYVWDEWNLLLVLDDNNGPVRKFTWGLDIAEQTTGLSRGGRPGIAAGGVGGLLAVEELSGTQSGNYVYFYDANGNVGQVVDWAAASIVVHYEYDPFGRTINSSGDYAEINRFRFSSKYQDQVTELYYYGYRYYSPQTGRWLNRDPINESGAQLTRQVNLTAEQLMEGRYQLNLEEERNVYNMLANDPLNNSDILGLFSCDLVFCDPVDCSACCGVLAVACGVNCFALVFPPLVAACQAACALAGIACVWGCS